MKKAIIWIVIILVLAAAVYGLAKFGAKNANNTNSKIMQTEVSASDYSQGPSDAKAVLVEYADFQCPACGFFHPLVEQLQKDFEGKLKFVYRFFPLNNIHANADIAARAAIAAGKQNKFWEMHDILFEKQDEWASKSKTEVQTIFNGYAQSLSLNIDQFKKDIDAPETEDIVKVGIANGDKDSVNSTPTFYLNGKEITPQSYDQFKQTINDVLK